MTIESLLVNLTSDLTFGDWLESISTIRTQGNKKKKCRQLPSSQLTGATGEIAKGCCKTVFHHIFLE